MNCALSPSCSEAGAIRPLDVAAIVAVLAVLTVVGLAVSARMKEAAQRKACMANLKQLGSAVGGYAKDHDGELPDCLRNPKFAGPVWPWDISTNLTTTLAGYGAKREVFYCPANPEMNDERHWNYASLSGGSVRVVGYGMLFPGHAQVSSSLWRSRIAPKDATSPSTEELMFDATAGVGDDFKKIQGTWIDRSNHMRKDRPLGGHVLFTDLRVDWRDFEQMSVRVQTFGASGPISWRF